MSQRLHVIAARGVSAVQFEQALQSLRQQESGQRECSPFHFGASNDWQWATASVWSVGGDEIDRALAGLQGVSLRTTSSDGVLWMLTVTGANQEPFRGVHFFTSVGCDWENNAESDEDDADPDFPDDEPDEVAGIDRDDPELQFLWDEEEASEIESRWKAESALEVPWRVYLDYGVVFSEATLSQMDRLSAHEAQRVAFYSHAEQIADALVERGVKFDRDALVRLLTNGPLTEWEQGSDLGNMLRFLSLLGINGINDEALAETPEQSTGLTETDIDWSQFQGREHLDSVRAIMVGREPTTVVGGPVSLRFTDVIHLLTVAHFCDADEGAVMVMLQFATDEFELTEPWTYIGDASIDFERMGRQCTLAWKPNPYWLLVEDRHELATHSVVAALATLPNGVQVEFIHSVEGTSDGCHRYLGVIEAGGFQLQSAYPSLTAKDIDDVLELMKLTLGSKPIPIENDEEASRMREAYHYVTGEKARIRDGKIKAEGGRHAVVQCKLVTQFRARGPWDIAGAERRRLEVDAELDALLDDEGQSDESHDDNEQDDPASAEGAEWAKKFEMMAEQMKQAKLVPRTQDLIFEGKVSRYFHAPILALKHITAEEIEELDRRFAELGFAWVCDSASDKFGETISRSYAGVKNAIGLYERRTQSNSHTISGEGYILDLSNGILEFQTHFNDGSSLVTNNVESAKSIPKKGIFIRSYEDIGLAELWEKHLDGINRLATKRSTTPRNHEKFNNPESFTRVVDELMYRYLN